MTRGHGTGTETRTDLTNAAQVWILARRQGWQGLFRAGEGDDERCVERRSAHR